MNDACFIKQQLKCWHDETEISGIPVNHECPLMDLFSAPRRHDRRLNSTVAFSFLRKQRPPSFYNAQTLLLLIHVLPLCFLSHTSHPPTLLTLLGSGEPNTCSSTVIGGLEQPLWFNELIQSVFSPVPPPCLSFFLHMSRSQLEKVLSCILFFMLSLIFPPFF